MKPAKFTPLASRPRPRVMSASTSPLNPRFLAEDVEPALPIVRGASKVLLDAGGLIPEMLDFFREHGMSVYLYGAKSDVIERAAREIESRYPGLSVAGYSHGYVEDPSVLIDRINAAKADAVVLGLGVPKQELWVANHGDQLESARILVCGGAIFDFISGNVIRAPGIVRRLRLEWLFRLVQEPRRLSSRYILGGFKFFYYLLATRR